MAKTACSGAAMRRALVLLTAFAVLTAGLHQRAGDADLQSDPLNGALEVASEQALRAALAAGSLGWRDRRALHLIADIQLSATLAITAPLRLTGACTDAAGQRRRCVLRGGTDGGEALPLLHVSGPAALVELSGLELVGGVGTGSLAGGLTASNHSWVRLADVRLAGNKAAAGGALRADSHARLSLTRCAVEGNAAQQAGGGLFAHSAEVRLEATAVAGNVAGEGGGVALAGSSRLLAAGSQLRGNRLLGGAAGREAGADLLFVDGEGSAAYLDLLPEGAAAAEGEAAELSVRGGQPQPLSLAARAAAGAADLLRPQRAVGPQEQPQRDELARAQQQQEQAVVGEDARGLGHPTVQQKRRDELSASERAVVDWMEAAGRRGGEVAVEDHKESTPRRSRKLKQAYTVGVTNEQELAEAIQNKERFIRLDSHIGLTGQWKGPQSVLPSVRASITITGNCGNEIFGGRCLLDAKSLGRIINVDNSNFAPSFFVTFENIRFTNGAAQGLGGAFFNQGRMQVEFNNCQFVTNTALNGAGAVSLADGAIGLFDNVLFEQNSAQFGSGGALYITSNAGFTRTAFQSNSAPSGGAVGVGQSSSGIYFNGCTFNGNTADVFGNDIYMESWVATPAYFNPFPTAAQVYPESTTVPYSAFTSWPAYPLFASPPPSPPSPPRPPPPSPPSPPNPASWVYTEEELWNALASGNSTITLGAHIQMTPGGRWWLGPPPNVIYGTTIVSQCSGFGSKCIIDLNGSPQPLFLIQQNAVFSASNVRILNGATMGNGAAVQVSGAVRSVSFDSCDFMGNLAVDGGAVNLQGSSNIRFTNCAFGVNQADNLGGAVKLVGANATFSGCTFYQNRAAQGGAIGMGPASNIVLLSSNFSDNHAGKVTTEGPWGDDIFIAAPAGSSIALNQLPPESVARIFPVRANTLQYSTPPPAPAPPVLLAPPFQRPPFPAPVPQPPYRVRAPPPSPPSPPPRPPPGPPSPPLGKYVKTTPIMWGPIALAGLLVVSLLVFMLLLCCHKRIFPRLEKPGELAQRLRGEYQPSDSEEEEMSVADPTASEIEVTLEGYYGTARFRRKAERSGAGPSSTPAAGPA